MQYVKPTIINTTSFKAPDIAINPQLSFRTTFNNYSTEVIVLINNFGERFHLDPLGTVNGSSCLEIGFVQEHGRLSRRVQRLGVQENTRSSSCGDGREFYDLTNLAAGGSMYIREFDVVVVNASFSQFAHHPKSTEGQYESHCNDEGIKLELVDNYERVSEIYADLYGNVIKVSAIVDRSRECGLYMRSFESRGKTNTMATLKFFPIEDLLDEKRTGLLSNVFHTKQQARNAVETKKAREEQAKLEYDKKIAELQKQIAVYNDTREQRVKEYEHETKMQALTLKHRSDERSFERNEATSLLKFIPTIITAGLAIFALAK